MLSSTRVYAFTPKQDIKVRSAVGVSLCFYLKKDATMCGKEKYV